MADLTMNKDRMEAVDFSVPFMNTGKSSRHLKIALTWFKNLFKFKEKVLIRFYYHLYSKGCQSCTLSLDR